MLLLNKSAVAVAEAIKRYSLNVNNITLTNNGLKAKECTLMIDSFTKHFQMIQTLTISKNKMGHDGAKFLAQSLPEMKILSKLIISDNEVGDHGVNDIIVACKTYCSIDYLDISGNNLGKTAASVELADNMHQFLSNNRTLEVLKMNWNSLRGVVAEKIIEGLLECYGLRELYMNNNLIGVSYDDK